MTIQDLMLRINSIIDGKYRLRDDAVREVCRELERRGCSPRTDRNTLRNVSQTLWSRALNDASAGQVA